MRKYGLLLCVTFTTMVLYAQPRDYIIRSFEYKTPVTAVTVSPDQQWIMAGFEDGTLRVLDVKTLEEVFIVENAASAPIFDIGVSPKMDVIFLAAGNRIVLYDTTGTKINSWGHHRNTMWSMDLNPTGSLIVSTEVNKTFLLLDVYDAKIEAYMRAHDDITLAVAFSPDGKQIASGSNDKTVLLWDLETREVTRTFHGHSGNIYDVAFSPDGSLLATASEDRSVRMWDIAAEKNLQLLQGHQDMVLEIEFSPDGKYLLSASADQAIKLWDVASGEQLYAYLENESSVPDIAFLPGGKAFISAGTDGTLKVWEIHPEIFVLKYFGKAYEEELLNNPLFLPRQKGEKRSEYAVRQEKAGTEKAKIIDRYYQMYLEGKHLEHR
jgi:WD40 repeat protein